MKQSTNWISCKSSRLPANWKLLMHDRARARHAKKSKFTKAFTGSVYRKLNAWCTYWYILLVWFPKIHVMTEKNKNRQVFFFLFSFFSGKYRYMLTLPNMDSKDLKEIICLRNKFWGNVKENSVS